MTASYPYWKQSVPIGVPQADDEDGAALEERAHRRESVEGVE